MATKPYKFYEFKGKAVPDDANEPVEKMLADKLECSIAVEALKSLRRDKVCGEIQIFDKKNPKILILKTNFGMVEGYDLVKEHSDDRFNVVVKRHIKNINMDFKGEKKNG
jgi:hypothetical protein